MASGWVIARLERSWSRRSARDPSSPPVGFRQTCKDRKLVRKGSGQVDADIYIYICKFASTLAKTANAAPFWTTEA